MKQETIDLSKLILIFKKNILSLALWAFAGLIISIIVSIFLMTPQYSSTVDLLVNQKADNTQAQYTAQQADLQAINTYKDVLEKDIILEPVLKTVKEKDNYHGNIDTLQKSLTITNETNSQILSVTVKDTNAYTAADIANTIGNVFTKKIKSMMKVDNVTIVNKAKVNTTPISPNKNLNAVIGLVIGAIIGFVIALVKELFDNTVKDANYLTEELGLTNLGVVYHIENDDKSYGVVRVLESDNDVDDEYNKRV